MKYLVWLRFSPKAAQLHGEPADTWMPNGDGSMGPKTAERIAREIKEDHTGVETKVRPANESLVVK